MSYTADDANKQFKLSAEQEAHVSELTSSVEISEFMKACAVENGAFQQMEGAAPGKLVAVPQAAQAVPTASVKIGYQTFTGTQAEIDAQVRQYFIDHPQPFHEHEEQPARDTNGRFTKTAADQGRHDESEALRVAAATELELKFKRGEVSAADYIAQSGVMDQYLASRGIDVKAHQAEQQTNQTYEQSWAQATAAFKQTEDGKTAPYGEGFVKVIGEKLIELGLEDSPSVDSLQRAYNALAIEAEMSKENDPYKMEDLRERYRQEVMGRSSGPRYNQ